ncbi:ML domain-containing protein [Paraphysoderma sedebokerense]|nr:ML domain-containing protein [Paraphysoderma sedebokerense]
MQNPLLLFSLIALLLVSASQSAPSAQFPHILDPSFSVSPTSIATCPRRDPKDDLLKIEEIRITPDPPRKGEKFRVYVKGHLSGTLDKGSIIKVVVKLGRFIQIFRTTLDLCDEAGKADKQCPLQSGEHIVDKDFELPADIDIPQGTYVVDINVYNQDGQHVTCLEAQLRLGGRLAEVNEGNLVILMHWVCR